MKLLLGCKFRAMVALDMLEAISANPCLIDLFDEKLTGIQFSSVGGSEPILIFSMRNLLGMQFRRIVALDPVFGVLRSLPLTIS